MGLNQKWYYGLGVAIPAVTTLLLWGVLKVFNLDVSTNIANTGITPGLLLGFANLFLTWAIFKHRI